MHVRRQLEDRRVDMAILPAIEDDASPVGVPLWLHSAVLIVPLNHSWARRKSARLSELDGKPMIMREEGSHTQRVLEAALKQAGVKPRTVLKLSSREGVLGAVAVGGADAVSAEPWNTPVKRCATGPPQASCRSKLRPPPET
jgi:DNA-binding transcriptional LysR family regulator